MLTALGTTDDKLEGFDAGADDYMTKPFEMRELAARIKVLLKRFSQQKQQKVFVLKYEGIEMNLEQKTVSRDQTPIKLTPKEFNLLKFMLENSERVLSVVKLLKKYGKPILIQEPISLTYTSIICERKLIRILTASLFIPKQEWDSSSKRTMNPGLYNNHWMN
jgi:two-component SAPR family response regulator